MTGYNGLNSIKTNLEAAGICKHDGLRLSDPKCTHATPAQIARTKKMDADYDFMQTYKDQARLCNRVIEDVSPRLNLFLEVCGDIDAQNGALLPIEVGGADVQDAVRWQDGLSVEDVKRDYTFSTDNARVINLNGYKATATSSWRERHLNES